MKEHIRQKQKEQIRYNFVAEHMLEYRKNKMKGK